MPSKAFDIPARSPALVGLILFQVACAAVFLVDVIYDLHEAEVLWHMVPEIAATVGLVLGIVFELRYLMGLLRRQETMARGLGVAAGALADLMEGYFREWGLTAAEQDVAAFTIKGYSIAEIAELRGSAEATVKTHLNAIYRKADVPGRGQLVSLLIEDLMRAPLVPSAEPDSEKGLAADASTLPETSTGVVGANTYNPAR
jgi:DNA-binding CsgD family transcriptional regulator